MTPPKPMLAAKNFKREHIRFPVAVQPKYDGIRCLVSEGGLYSRTLKPIPNRYITDTLTKALGLLNGFDGELVVGSPIDPMCYRNSMSGVMSGPGEPLFTYVVFDRWDVPHLTYAERRKLLIESNFMVEDPVKVMNDALLPHAVLAWETIVMDHDALEEAIQRVITMGYEGAIIRGLDTLYKYGRSTNREGGLIKYKEWEDTEAKIIAFEELYVNGNEPTRDARGLQVRSSHKANMIPAGTLGALRCMSPQWKDTFTIGSGFDDATRQEIWANKGRYLNRFVKFKHFKVGGYDKPRFPIFLGMRDERDM